MKDLMLAALVAGGLTLLPLQARADDGPAPLGLSVALERVAGFSYGSARLDGVNGESFGATAFTLAGAAIDPIDLPRLSGDAILPSGLTLGGALGYSHAELAIKPDSGQSGTLDGEVWLLSPRAGYRIRMSPLIDLWPRGGVTFARAGFTDGSNNSYSLFYTAISLDMAAVLRVTQSFNVLGGLAYDHVIAGSGSETEGGQSADLKAGGQLLGFSLWFGLGGYVL
jgi:hypothetical protein